MDPDGCPMFMGICLYNNKKLLNAELFQVPKNPYEYIVDQTGEITVSAYLRQGVDGTKTVQYLF